MIKRNVFLGAIAVTCAIGSAFASKDNMNLSAAYIRADIGDGTGTQCRLTTVSCSNTGTANCKIQILLQDGSSVPTNGRIAPSACTFQKQNTANPISATISGGGVPVSVEDYIPAQ